MICHASKIVFTRRLFVRSHKPEKGVVPMTFIARASLTLPAAPQPTQLSQLVSGIFAGRGKAHLYGSGALLLALQSGMVLAQTPPAPAPEAPAAIDNVDKVIVTGTRRS